MKYYNEIKSTLLVPEKRDINLISINNKNIVNIDCKLWDKQKQMKTVIDDIKISYNFSPEMFNKSINKLNEIKGKDKE